MVFIILEIILKYFNLRQKRLGVTEIDFASHFLILMLISNLEFMGDIILEQ